MSLPTMATVVTALLAVSITGAQPEGFARHARFLGIGACLKTLVGPGPEPGTERLYASHIYGGDTLDVVATDPLTGKTDAFPSPVPSECGAWAMALGPDGQVYVGTLPELPADTFDRLLGSFTSARARRSS